MCRIRFALLTILLGFCTAADIANAGEAEAWTALHTGRHVALMRHTDAPGGAGDPPGFRLDDCATQRNLSAKGRAVEKILSSPWCRCMDTAKLAELGAVEAEPTFGNVVVLSDQRASLTAGARAVIDKWSGSGILLVVTHGANIFALTGISPASGEIVVVRSGSGGRSEPVGRLVLD
jgi:hypothetical protein